MISLLLKIKLPCSSLNSSLERMCCLLAVFLPDYRSIIDDILLISFSTTRFNFINKKISTMEHYAINSFLRWKVIAYYKHRESVIKIISNAVIKNEEIYYYKTSFFFRPAKIYFLIKNYCNFIKSINKFWQTNFWSFCLPPQNYFELSKDHSIFE